MLLVLLVAPVGANAQAGSGEWHVSALGHSAFAQEPRGNWLGGGAGVSAFYGVNDTISFGAHTQLLHLRSLASGPTTGATPWLFGFGSGVNLDASWLVPYGSAMLTVLRDDGLWDAEHTGWQPGVRLAVGFDVRTRRDRAWGVVLDANAFWPTVLDGAFLAQASFRYSWIFQPGRL